MNEIAPLALFLSLFALPGFGQKPDNLQQLEQKYQDETDPVRRARALAKLSKDEIRAVHTEIHDGQIDQAYNRLARYRDSVRQVQQALDETDINVVKKPRGFEELQIALREDVQHLRDIISVLPLEGQGRFEILRQDLEQSNNHLLEELFPPPPPATPHKQEKH